MARGTEAYDRRFYETIRAGCQRSAAAAVPVILDAIGPVASVVDVGCGEGWWLDEFRRNGATRVLGLDGGDARPVDEISYQQCDLTRPIVVDETFDLAVTLEVAEHLPAKRGESFVAELCQLAELVLFSAAMPGQGGTGHVNCQPPAYWAGLFAGHGYAASGALRWRLWDLLDVEPWYRSNLLLFAADPYRFPDLFPDLFGGPADGPLHVVAPDLWITR